MLIVEWLFGRIFEVFVQSLRIMEDDENLVRVKDSCLKNTVRMGSLGVIIGKLFLLPNYPKHFCHRSSGRVWLAEFSPS